MYALISVLLIAVGFFMDGNYMPWCCIASGLFAIASAIDSLGYILKRDRNED